MLSINDHQNVHSRSLLHPYLEGDGFRSYGSDKKQVTLQTGMLIKGPGQRWGQEEERPVMARNRGRHWFSLPGEQGGRVVVTKRRL